MVCLSLLVTMIPNETIRLKKKYLYQWWNTLHKFCPMAIGKTTSEGVCSHVWKQYVLYFEAESRNKFGIET